MSEERSKCCYISDKEGWENTAVAGYREFTRGDSEKPGYEGLRDCISLLG